MPNRGILWLALAALTARAGEPRQSWQVGLGLNSNQGVQVSYLGGLATIKRESKGAPAVFAGRQVWSFGSSELSFTGEYQFLTRSTITTNLGLQNPAFRSRFLAPGLQWTWHGAVDAGLGLQARFERLEGAVLGTSVRTSYNRAWVNGTFGYTFPASDQIAPYLGLRIAAALRRTQPPALADLGTAAGNQTLLRALQGDAEAALQLGVRF